MKSYTKRALKSGVVAGICFGLITVGIEYFSGEDLELWKLIFKTLFFGVFMTIYFNYSFKKNQSK